MPRIDPKDFFNTIHYSKKHYIPHTSVIRTDLLWLIMETSPNKRHLSKGGQQNYVLNDNSAT